MSRKSDSPGSPPRNNRHFFFQLGIESHPTQAIQHAIETALTAVADYFKQHNNLTSQQISDRGFDRDWGQIITQKSLPTLLAETRGIIARFSQADIPKKPETPLRGSYDETDPIDLTHGHLKDALRMVADQIAKQSAGGENLNIGLERLQTINGHLQALISDYCTVQKLAGVQDGASTGAATVGTPPQAPAITAGT